MLQESNLDDIHTAHHAKQAFKLGGLVGAILFVIVIIFWSGYTYSIITQLAADRTATAATLATDRAEIENMAADQAALKQSIQDTNQQLTLIRDQLQQLINQRS